MAKVGIEKRMTTGNLWTIATMVAAIVGGTGYQHFNPSTAATDAKAAADVAVAKAAVASDKVDTHTRQIAAIENTLGNMQQDVAVLKSQGVAANAIASKQGDDIAGILKILYEMRGASYASRAASNTPR